MKKTILVVLLSIPVLLNADVRKDDITPLNVFNAVNTERVVVGIRPLEKTNRLDAIAKAKLEDIIIFGYWSHYNPYTGASPWYWFAKAKYQYSYAGENLAKGFSGVSCLMNCEVSWMQSPTHKANILNPKFTSTGIAVGNSIVVQVFTDK